MKTLHALSSVALLASLLSACSAGTASPSGTRPELPTGAEVRHPAASSGSPVYLSLLSDSGESFYQTSVAAGQTVTTVDPSKWQGKEAGKTGEVSALVPTDATNLKFSNTSAQVLLLHWAIWQDKNSNGKLEDGEDLALITHDRVVYAAEPVSVSFTTASPKMNQTWTFTKGWSRAEHFVYLPQDTDTYERSLETKLPQRYELHQPTPITSM
ncbi:hypothetical protein [Deinococcus alpinitundrae]|uniref:hypothetical protein n=1 Tax=Deinococcus alpinitundrae TaxID=468913 RepID=UPI00137B4EDD|nr:hypothetical protein [Deinococcus alpinitundrae]